MTQRKPDAGMLQNEWRDRQRLAASQITNGSGSVQIPEGPDSILPQHAAFRHDRLMIVLRPCAVRYKFQLCTGFTRPFWPVRCRPAEGTGQLPKQTAEAGGPLRYSAIAHSCMMVSFYEPRATIFSRAEVHSRRCRHSEFVAAKRHFESEAACDLRTAGPLGQFTE